MTVYFKESVRKIAARVRLLTLLILVAGVAFMVRIGDAVTNARSISGAAFAEETLKEGKVAATGDVKPTEGTKVETAKDSAATEPPLDKLTSQEDIQKRAASKERTPSSEEQKDVSKSVDLPSIQSGNGKKWQDAAETDTDFPEIKKEMYQDLMKRRQELDEKEKQLAQREALLEASKKEIDHKYKEMVTLRDEIQGLLKTQTDAEDARINSLVKIYSGMKPKDAARIFNTLDMDILIAVISKMPEAKSGAIIATMDADPARALTTMLAEQKNLPSVPQ